MRGDVLPNVIARGISKTYKSGNSWWSKSKKNSYPAVDGVSINLYPGECVAYLGRNGSGKSTTVKILSGIITPDNGTVSICGFDPFKQRKKVSNQIGVVFGQRSQLWPDLSVRNSLDTIRQLYRVSDSEYQKILGFFLQNTNLESFWDAKSRLISLGQRTLADIVAALIHRPALLLLDEPTVGLDLAAKAAVYRIIQEAQSKWNMTVMITSHDMQDVETLASRVLMLDKGKITFDGSLTELKAVLKPRRIVVVRHHEHEHEHPALIAGVTQVSVPGGTWLATESPSFKLSAFEFLPSEIDCSVVINRLATLFKIEDLEVIDETLTQMMTRYYQGDN